MINTVCKLCENSYDVVISYSGEMRHSGQFDKFKDGAIRAYKNMHKATNRAILPIIFKLLFFVIF